MNDQKSNDKLLDEVLAKIKKSPVPEYPGLTIFNETTVVPKKRRQSPRSFAALGALACSLLCGVLAVTALRQQFEFPSMQVTDSTDVGQRSVQGQGEIRHPIQTITHTPTPKFTEMLEGLDHLSERLDQLEVDVAWREVQSETAALIAEYKPSQSNF